MKEIILTKGFTTQVSDEGFDFFNTWSWCASQCGNHIYAMRKDGGKTVYLHRLVAIRKGLSELEIIDHDDRSKVFDTPEKAVAWRNQIKEAHA